VHYTILLRELGQQKAILGQIFIKSQNKIQDPAKLYKLIDMINKEQWSGQKKSGIMITAQMSITL